MSLVMSLWAAMVLAITNAPTAPDDVLRPYQGIEAINGDPAGLILGVWQRFDTLWYVKIATEGYSPEDGSTVDFSPVSSAHQAAGQSPSGELPVGSAGRLQPRLRRRPLLPVQACRDGAGQGCRSTKRALSVRLSHRFLLPGRPLLRPQEALGLLAQPIMSHAVGEAQRVWFVIYQRAPDEAEALGEPNANKAWLDNRYHLTNTLKYNDLNIYLYELS
jgi:hypothetical protein